MAYIIETIFFLSRKKQILAILQNSTFTFNTRSWIKSSLPKVRSELEQSFNAWVIFLYYSVDVLWGKSIKLAQVASTSELHENQWKDLLFFEIVVYVISAGPQKYKHKIGHNYFTFSTSKKVREFC